MVMASAGQRGGEALHDRSSGTQKGRAAGRLQARGVDSMSQLCPNLDDFGQRDVSVWASVCSTIKWQQGYKDQAFYSLGSVRSTGLLFCCSFTKSSPTLCDAMDCSLPVTSVHSPVNNTGESHHLVSGPKPSLAMLGG